MSVLKWLIEKEGGNYLQYLGKARTGYLYWTTDVYAGLHFDSWDEAHNFLNQQVSVFYTRIAEHELEFE